MKQRHVVVLMSLSIAGLLGLSVYMTISMDRIPPVITIPDKEITYKEGADTDSLLKDVTAWDDVDSNITDKLRIDTIIPDKDGLTAVVVYAVYDSSNNVTKEKRTVSYKAMEKDEKP